MNNVQWGKPSTFRGGITIAGGEPEDISIERNTANDDQGGKTQDYGLMVTSNTRIQNLRLKDNKFDRNGVSPVFRP